MPICAGCKKDREEASFISTTTRGVSKPVKKCQVCRDKTKEWREKNKERIKAYNAGYKEGKAWNPEEHGMAKAGSAPSSRRTPHLDINGIMGKACCTCKNWRPLTEYGKLKSHWDGLRNDCNHCLREYRASEKRKAQMTQYNKEYWVKTKDVQTEQHRQWKAANRERVNAYGREYMRIWGKHQRETNPQYKITKNMRCRLWHAVKAQGTDKTARTFELVGCSSTELMQHLEAQFAEGMTWENYGEWHVDHIKPCAAFDLTCPEQQKTCFHFSNLQPLWGPDNCSKGAQYEEESPEEPSEVPASVPAPPEDVSHVHPIPT